MWVCWKVEEIAEIESMESLSLSEENYLKAIFSLGMNQQSVSTRAIARELKAKDSSVTDMVKKLSTKGLLDYVKYKGVSLTGSGRKASLVVIRRHRLWEVFLVEKLGFRWDEVHNIAEQLEHIQSGELVNRLDEFLGFPERDPHGAPIPNREGDMPKQAQILLSDAECGHNFTIVRVKDDSSGFLQYLDATGIGIGDTLTLLRRIDYDDSLQMSLEGGKEVQISRKVSDQILVAES